MAYNGSGTFLINTAGQPVVAGTVISSTTFNSLTADLATGLSTVITKDGQTTVTANIPMASFKFTGLGVGSAAGDSANLSQVQSTVTKLLTSVSGTDTITAVGAPVVAAYAAGQMFYFVATGDNTTSVTINIDGLGAKAVTRDGSVALVAGDIKSGEVVVVVYDGTRFQVVSQLNSAGNATFANVSITSALNVGGVATFSAGTAGAPSITTTGDTNTGIFFPAADTIAFTEGGVEAARFDSSGNLGLGVTPSAWSGFRALQIGGTTSLWSSTSGNSSSFYTNNGYFNGSNRLYLTNGFASEYIQGSGQHIWYTAASGTAGNTISFTQAMTLDASGSLLVGATAAVSGRNEFRLGGNGSGSLITMGRSGTNKLNIGIDSSDNVDIENTANTPIRIYTNSTERCRITAAGEFLISTTTTAGNGKFSSNHESASTAGASSARIWNQIKNVAASNNATVDVWLGRDAAGNVIGNNSLVGHFNVFVIGASGVNAFAGVYSILTTGNGTSQATLSAVSTVTRGTSPVSSIQIAADGGSGAIKLTITYINNAGVVTGGNSQVSFIGQII